jgi:hypothetical protein
MKPQKRHKSRHEQEPVDEEPSPRNYALHILRDFEKAVEGLLNIKPMKKQQKN